VREGGCYDRLEDDYVLASIALARKGGGMTDPIERAQEQEQANRDAALERLPGQCRPGLTECEECGEPITEIRRQLGARLCVPHQNAVEAEQKKRRARTCV